MLPTGFRTFHFVSFLCVFFLFFSFSFVSFLFSLFCFRFFAFRFFAFLFVTFLLVFFSFFLSVSFRFFFVFFRFSVYRYPITLLQNIVKMMQLLTYICCIVHLCIFICMLFRQGIKVVFSSKSTDSILTIQKHSRLS